MGEAGISDDWDDVLSRALDVTLALVLLAFFLPLMALIAIIIHLRDPGPVLFTQDRVGRHGFTFACFKFRTMTTDAEQRLAALLASDPEARREWTRQHKLRRDPRVTSFGAFLRRSSLDELPQLFNILLGDMSLVGPRPIVPREAVRYGRYFRHYCRVRPGLTGLWQVRGRNNLSYRRRVALDVTYTRRRSTMLNLSILTATVPTVLFARGSY